MAIGLPPPPTTDATGSFAWLEWFRQLRNYISTAGSVPWSILDFSGSNITDIVSRSHQNLQSNQGGTTGQYYHLTQDKYNEVNDNLDLSGTSGTGIKVDTTTPTFGWHDLLGPISIRGIGAADPSYNVYLNNIRGYQFDVNEEAFVEFHLPHDYVPGTDLHIHAHWSVKNTTSAGVATNAVTGGSVTWGFNLAYAKGHNQAAFTSPASALTVTQNASTTQYQHMIAEVQMSATSPSTAQIDTDNLEVDGLILVRVYLSANNLTVSSGNKPAPFLHMVDIHYQSTGLTTKNKAPNFYV
jgi:hypothetical protein